MAHAGLQTLARDPLAPELGDLVDLVIRDPLKGPDLYDARITSLGRVGVGEDIGFDRCLLDARLTGRARIEVADSLITAMLDGVAFSISRCRIGSGDHDGIHYRATEDGIRPCPLPGSTLPAQWSFIVDTDIINTDGRNGSRHMDGIQLWMGGSLLVERTKIDGWWQSAIMLKTDWGPIDDVMIRGCVLSGAQYFQLRFVDGGYGRPTNVSVIDCVVDFGYKGGAHPVNTGDDLCSVKSQTRYVRTEAERLDPTWVVYSGVVDRDGSEIPPRGGWYEP